MISRTDPPRNAAALYLLDGVRDYFKSVGVTTAVVFGFKERDKQINQGVGGGNRIVIVPGRIPKGEDGNIRPARGSGGNPRKLYSQDKIVTISLWAGAPNADSRNEETLYGSLDVLEEQFLSALQAVVQQNVAFTGQKYNADPVETRFGLEYLLEIALDGNYRALETAVPAFPTPVVNRGTEEAPTPPAP